ncbi:WGxxGxxG-CTERM domain-containing protein [Leptolyngbya subtilissima ST-M1]|uniref:WGxxGxxG family protein n=1 Tax=Cyanophyceae TaxID=3028117 RepID=UPI0018EFB695|nr:WGxxGxxG family protein [Nodosilinea sp. FACHB-131]
MKSNVVSRWVGGSALALGLTLSSSMLPASAQTTTEPVTPTAPGTVDSADSEGTTPGSAVPGETYPDPVTPTAPGTVDQTAPGTVSPDATAPSETYVDPAAPDTTTTTAEDNDSSWGWLGLLGLLGLSGLAKRKRPTPVYTTEDRVVDHPSAGPRI